MKLVTIERNGYGTLGVKTYNGIIDIEKALAVHSTKDSVPTDVMIVFQNG